MLPSAGAISLGQVQTVFGATSLGAARRVHPLAAAAGSGMISLGGLRGAGANLAAWHDAGSFSGNVWLDKSAAAAHATQVRGAPLGNWSSANAFGYVAGRTADGVTFRANLFGSNTAYTFLHLSRYGGSNRQRIFDAAAGNSASGFLGGNVGACVQAGNAITSAGANTAAWALSAERRGSYRLGGNELANVPAGPGAAYPLQLTINSGNASTQRSDWQVAELVAFDRALPDAEVAAIESYVNKKYGLDVSQLPRVAMHARDLNAASGQANVSVWNGFTAGGTAPPVLFHSGGFADGPFVRLDRANSQYFVSQANLTFNIATNGGFTALALGRWTSTPGSWERFFDFGQGTSNNLLMARNGLNNWLNVGLRNGATLTQVNAGGALIQNEWAVFAGRYTSASANIQASKNGALFATATGALAITDRTLPASTCHVGRSNFGDAYAALDLSRLLIYDRSLTDVEMTTALQSCVYGAANVPAPANAQVSLDARDLVAEGNKGFAWTWGLGNSAMNASFSSGIPPRMMPLAFSGKPSVVLDRAKAQYFNTTNVPFNVGAGGGLTIATHVKPVGAPAAYERIVDALTGPYPNVGFQLYRSNLADAVSFDVYNSNATLASVTSNAGALVQGQWTVLAARFVSANCVQIFKDNVIVGNAATAMAGTDRVQANVAVGGSWNGNASLGAEVRAVYAWDRALTDAELTATYAALTTT